MIMGGATHDTIAAALRIHRETLAKHYREDINLGLARANAVVAGKLFERCMDGDMTAIIWWEKTRSGMSEKKIIDQRSSDGSMTPKGMADADLTGAILANCAKLGIDPAIFGICGGE